MNKTEMLVYKSTLNRVKYFQENKFDRYVILDYIDTVLTQVRKSNLCSDDLLNHLFDMRQKVLLCKEVK